MSSKAYAERLGRALDSTGLVQVVTTNFAENRINVLCRVSKEKTKEWTALIQKILIATDEEAKEVHAWQSHICQHYFLKPDEHGNQNLVYGWNFSIQAREMPLALDKISALIKGKPLRTKDEKEVEEFPLVGASANRNKPGPGGKGVHLIGEREFHPSRRS